MEQIQGNGLTNVTKRNARKRQLSTKIVRFGCSKIDRQQKEEGSKDEDRQGGADVSEDSQYFFLHQLLLVSPLLCFILLLLSVYLLAPDEDFSYQKHSCTIIFLHFVTLVSTFPQICSIFVNLTSGSSLISREP